jgi:serine/threonine-protein kinase
MTEPVNSLRESLAGRYLVERELGEGGMATVYLAVDVRHGRKVAIKVIRPEVAGAVGTDRFLAEIKLTASLQHPHILALLDSGVVSTPAVADRPFYVMPYIAGETLRERLTREGPLPIRDAVTILAEVADALASAHQQRIVHRDIKPENILLGQGHAMVADFGVAKALHRLADGPGITGVGVTLGTPEYMAPEQAVGDPSIDHRADLYALGVMAYEVLAGRTPFSAPSIAGIIAAVLTQPAPSLTSEAPACPRQLAALVESLLAKDPAARPESAASVRDTLRSILVDISTGPRGASPRPSSRRRALIGALAGVAIVASAGVALWRPWRTASSTPSPRVTTNTAPRSIAVLPFDNIGGDSTGNYFSDGMAEELISALGRLRGLRVASRTSTFAMKGQTGGLGEVSRKLGVQTVLEGSVRRIGTKVRVTARLVDVARDSTLWDGEYDSQLRDVLFVQDSLARAIVGALSVALSDEPGAALARPRSGDPQAYDAYLRGRFFLGQRNPGAIASAIRSFEAAIKRDSTLAPAYAGLADAYSLTAPIGGRRPRDVFPLARAAAQHALALDSTLAEAHTSMGIVSMFYDWNWPAARQHLLRATELNPSYAEGHFFYCHYLLFRGHMAGALQEIARAQMLDPLSVIIATRHGTMLQFAGRDAEAIPVFRQALEIDSTFFFSIGAELAAALLQTGQRDAARTVAARVQPNVGSGEGGFPAWVLAQLGDTAGARKQVRILETAAERGYVSADALAAAYAGLGDTTRALNLLEKAADDRAFTLVFLANYRFFSSLHGTARFKRLVERVGVVPPP